MSGENKYCTIALSGIHELKVTVKEDWPLTGFQLPAPSPLKQKSSVTPIATPTVNVTRNATLKGPIWIYHISLLSFHEFQENWILKF